MVKRRTKIIACQTVGEELWELLPPDFDMEMLEYGLHNIPEKLHIQLQEAINRTSSIYSTILLGYGMCANAMLGIHSGRFRLVIPKVDDCIALFLGSRLAYKQQFHQAPGTYYLTRGWIKYGEDPYTEFCAFRTRFGDEKAARITKQYIRNYTRLAYITSKDQDSEAYRKYAMMVADYFGLMYEEIGGSMQFFDKFIQGNWDNDFIVLPPDNVVSYEMFLQ